MVRLCAIGVQGVVLAFALLLVCAPPSPAQQSAEELIASALERKGAGDYASARAFFVRYLDQHPGGLQADAAAFGIGDCYFAEERWSDAIEAFRRALRRFADTPLAAGGHFHLAEARLKLGFIQEALESYREALASAPDPDLREQVLLRLGDTYYELGNFREATEPLSLLLSQHPGSPEESAARLQLADSYHRIGQYQRARDNFAVSVERNPRLFEENTELRFQWAECLLFTEEYDQAREILRDLLRQFPSGNLHPHVVMRLGDLERMEAAGKEQEEKRAGLRRAIDYYMRLLPDTASFHSDVTAEEMRILNIGAVLRIVQAADAGELDVSAEFGIASADELLQQALDSAKDAEERDLVLLYSARHNLAWGREAIALRIYRELVQGPATSTVAAVGRTEYAQVVQRLMEQASSLGDYPSLVEFYAVDGQALDLEHSDLIVVADSYLSMQISDKAHELFSQIAERTTDPELWSRATLGLAQVEVQEREYDAALQRLDAFLRRNPSDEEREQATLLILDTLFLKGDQRELRNWWYERTERLTTPALRATALFKTASMLKRNGELAEATRLAQRFEEEFGAGVHDNLRVYGYAREALRMLADLYFEAGDCRQAVQRYERYIALFGDAHDIAWPLFQTANCRMRLGQEELAILLYEELIRLYPDHDLRNQARATLDEIEERSRRSRRNQ